MVPYRITWRDLPGNKLTLKTLLEGSTMVLMKSKEDPKVLLAINDAPRMSEINAEFSALLMKRIMVISIPLIRFSYPGKSAGPNYSK